MTNLRTKARTLNPEAFDPGEPVTFRGHSGVVWSLGPENSARTDSRWIVCTDGIVRLLIFSKGKGSVLTPKLWDNEVFTPSRPVPFTLNGGTGKISRGNAAKTVDNVGKLPVTSSPSTQTPGPRPITRRITKMAVSLTKTTAPAVEVAKAVKGKTPTADDVRAFARAKGLEVADHGRLSAEVIAAYNKGRKNVYSPTMVQASTIKTVDVPGYKIGKNGRKTRVTFRNVPVSEIRAWAQEAGFPVGARGRIPAEVLTAFGSRDLPTE